MRVHKRNDPETKSALPTLLFLKETIEQERSAQIRNKNLVQKENPIARNRTHTTRSVEKASGSPRCVYDHTHMRM